MIGYTKILECIWMVELKMIVSGRRGEKLVIIPTKRFDVPSGRIGNQFFGILNVEIERIWYCQ